MAGNRDNELIAIMNLLNAKFDYGAKNTDPHFWLGVLQRQLDEGYGHHAQGLRTKVLNEIADCVLVAWTALEKLGEEPEAFIMRRIHDRILPDIAGITKKNSDIA